MQHQPASADSSSSTAAKPASSTAAAGVQADECTHCKADECTHCSAPESMATSAQTLKKKRRSAMRRLRNAGADLTSQLVRAPPLASLQYVSSTEARRPPLEAAAAKSSGSDTPLAAASSWACDWQHVVLVTVSVVQHRHASDSCSKHVMCCGGWERKGSQRRSMSMQAATTACARPKVPRAPAIQSETAVQPSKRASSPAAGPGTPRCRRHCCPRRCRRRHQRRRPSRRRRPRRCCRPRRLPWRCTASWVPAQWAAPGQRLRRRWARGPRRAPGPRPRRARWCPPPRRQPGR